eukprot:6187894-Pleurochrysis_carterae.AAC.2
MNAQYRAQIGYAVVLWSVHNTFPGGHVLHFFHCELLAVQWLLSQSHTLTEWLLDPPPDLDLALFPSPHGRSAAMQPPACRRRATPDRDVR